MHNLTPVCATEGHVKVENRHTETEIVLVEYSLECRAKKFGTGSETIASPRVKAASLKLDKRVRGA